MSTELAVAYVSLSVSARGIKNEIDREVGQPLKRVALQGEKDLTASAKSAAGAHQGSAKLAAAAWAGAGVGLAATAKSAVSSFSSAVGEVAKLQRLTGGSAEDLSKLRGAAKLVNIDTDKLGRGIVLLSKQAAAGKLDEYGISLKDAAGNARPFGEVLGDVAEKIKDTPAGFERNALAVKLFGRSGTDLIPILKGGRDGLRELTDEAGKYGSMVTDKDIEANKAFLKSQRELGLEVDKLKVNIGRELIPVVKGVADVGLKAAAGLDAIPGPIKGVVALVGGIGIAGNLGAKGLGFVGDGLTKVKDLSLGSARGLKDVVNGLRGVESAGAAAAAGEEAAAGGITSFLNPAMLAAVAALGTGIGVYEAWKSAADAARKAEQANAKDFLTSSDQVASAQKALQKELSGTREATGRYGAAFRASGLIVGQVAKDLANGADFDKFRDKVDGAFAPLSAQGIPNLYKKFSTDTNRKLNIDSQLDDIRIAAKAAGPEVAKTVDGLIGLYKTNKLTGDQFRATVDGLAEVAKGYKFAGADLGAYSKGLRKLLAEKGPLRAADAKDLDISRDTTVLFDKRKKALERLAERYPDLAAKVGIEEVATAKAAAQEEKHAASLKEVAAGLEGVNVNLKRQALNYQAGEAAAGAYIDSINRLTPNRKLIDTSVSFSAATKALLAASGGLKGLPEDLNPVTLAFTDLTDEQRQALQAVETWGDAAHASIARFIAQGDYEKATFLAAVYREQLDKILRSAGLGESAVAAFNDEVGLAQGVVETSIKLSGMEEARFQLQTYIDLVGGKLDDTTIKQVITDMKAGNFEAANAHIDEFLAKQDQKEIHIKVFTDIIAQGQANNHDRNDANGGQPSGAAPAAKTAPISATQGHKIGLDPPHVDGKYLRYDNIDNQGRAWDWDPNNKRWTPHFLHGGLVKGLAGPDKVKAYLTAGEFVVTAQGVASAGLANLEALNAGQAPASLKAAYAVDSELGTAKASLGAAGPAKYAVTRQDGPTTIFSPRADSMIAHAITTRLLDPPSWTRPMTAEELGVSQPSSTTGPGAGGKVVHQTNHISLTSVTPSSVGVELPGALRAAARELG